ncbi:zinc finger FYVE domain-containing protein 26 homolog [Culex quinquefasciatus]|uniref:zinc finger FYVE domain-containing protein 26 homolog n=1 Tax=Culex quinquefasciatus TaxID=7176 RepID=UPI0018E3A397|nr:zinc finger FYVE domain-containing protein 26 homolog [Culex quinquefasciatus]
MDRFNEYWEQLSNKSDPIGKELISYYKTLHETEDGSHLSEHVCNFLLQNLLRNPYPTCQLLRLLATSRIPSKNSAIREVCDAGMVDFLESFSAEKGDKFYNLIANNLLSSGAIDQVVPAVLEMLGEGKVDRERLLLALVARRSQKLLKQFLREMEVPREVQFLMEVIDGKRHFVERILTEGGQIPFQDEFVRDYIRLFQVISEVNAGKAVEDVPAELVLPEGSALKMYHLELKRTQLLQKLFSGSLEDTLRMQDYAKESSVLALYLKQRKLIEPAGYEQLLEVIAENDRLNREILAGVEVDQPEDYKLLQMLILWKHVMEMIQLPPQLHTFEAILEIKTNAIRNTLKSVDDVQIFVELLESLLTLLFVRYEHLSQKSTTSGGFMCSPAVLEASLNCLEIVVTQRKHATNYVDASDHLKQRLADSLAIINDSLWRLSLFKEMSSTKDSQLQLTDAESANIILKLPDLVQDDEDRVFQSVDLDVPKRRHSKRHQRYSQPSSSGSTSHKLLTTQHSLPLPNKLPAATSSLSSLSVSKPKALFSKILGSPERLTTLCLVNKNLEAARAIVKTRNLTDTAIGQDLTFLDSFAQVQDKLTTLIANYDRMRSAPTSRDDPLQEIRSRTAIGFEASKIVSTVENFALGQRIEQSDDDRQLLEKYTGQYPFLRLFQSDSLKNIHAVDLLLGLPMSYDLNLALYNLVEKSVDGSDSGYAGFLKRLIDNMHQYKLSSDGRREVTFHELLSREVCSLDPAKLGAVLESRSQIGTLRSLEDVPPGGRWVVFRKVQRFVEQVEKLLKLHGEWDESFKSGDAIRQDLEAIVSRLVFAKGVALGQLEPMVAGTSSNLAHIIARNYVWGVGKSPRSDLGARAEVLEYVNGKNDLLGALLKQIVNGSGDHALLNNLNELPAVIACKDLYGNVTAAGLDYDRYGLELLDAIEDDLERLNYLELIEERVGHGDGDRIQELRHEIVSRLIESDRVDVPLQQIIMRTKDVRQQAEYLLRVINRFPNAHTIIQLIQTVQLSKEVSELPPQTQQSLAEWLSKLQVYIEVGQVLENDDWRSVQSLSESNKELVLYQLVQQNLYDLCSRWIRIHPLQFNEEDSRLLDVFTLALTKASRESDDCSALLEIIEGLPAERVVRFYETILLGVKSEAIIRHAIEYLERNGNNRKIYQKYRISLEIFAHLPVGSSERLWHLISRPLLIVEQFLMNSKLELLTAVMSSMRPLLVAGTVCQICFEQREYIRDLRRRISGSINLDSSHDDQFITNECVDSLLRIYAGKALDYRVSNDSATSGESMHDQSTDLSSLDSLCGAFVMPKEAPTKDGWVRDEDASHCMCCRRSVFSMLNRRHHCRRCGRVVCHGCSKKKLVIPELYEEVPVRACDDCVKQSQQAKLQVPAQNAGKVATGGGLNESTDEWQLTGNVRNDNILREEYSYEYAPSTSQCLAICNLHSQNDEISSFLLYHCVNLETLLRPIHPGYPNPEIDYALVARMLLNLTLVAKVRGLDFAEADKIKEHAEIILSMVKNDCEALLLQESMSSANLRKLRDALVRSEKWALALELSTKCGFATSGVMAAWGNTCLRAGCYETAREKLSHCLQRMSTDSDNSTILNCIESPETKLASYRTAIPLKRPSRSPPLLLEIISILESTAQAQPPEVIARASKIKSSNTSLASSGRIKNNAPLHEPALNVLNTLANLKHIAKGNFTDFLPERRALRTRDLKQPLPANSTDYLHGLDCIMSTWFFEESMFYLLSYGAHQDIVAFLVKHRQLLPAMKYVLMQHVDPEVFLQTILLPYIRRGKLETIIEVMGSMDETLLIWKNYIIHTCRYLEANRMLNCLYNLQLLLGDPIRASMTCVRFYSMDAKTFTDLEANTFHLKNSASHLEAELELCHWEEVTSNETPPQHSRSETHKSLLMKMDPKELNSHINTILRQLEVAKYLANCEAKGRDVIGLLLPKLFIETARIPTLFGNGHERLQLAVLVLICGKNVDEGFGLSYRIIQDFNLSSLRVYTLTAKFFINESRIDEVEKLLQAIAGNGGGGLSGDAADTAGFCDELIRNCVEMAIGAHGSSSHIKSALEALIKRVADVGTKIHCYCVTGQLKSAYLLANRTGRLSDVRKILRQAEVLNQGHVKRLCQAKLAGEGGSGGSGSAAMGRKSTG